VKIGKQNSRDRSPTKDASFNTYQYVINVSVRTCKFEDLSKFTEEVGDFKVCAE
jgi:hypothetical protein